MATEREGEYRAGSDHTTHVLDELRQLEQIKRGVEPGTEEFIGLAHQVEDLTRQLFRWTQYQSELAHASPRAREAGELTGRPIEAMSARRVHQVLAEWREAETRLSQARPGSPEAAEAEADARRLYQEYRQMQEREQTS